MPPQFQHRVLFLGVLGALVFRGSFIAAGAALIENFGVKMLLLEVLYIPTTVSHAVITTILTVSVVASLHATRGQARRAVDSAAAGPFRMATDDELAEARPIWRT